MHSLAEKLIREGRLSLAEYTELLDGSSEQERKLLQRQALFLREQYYGRKVFVRGLIEFTSYCKNNCYYCGIRSANTGLCRYRLEESEILECCLEGYRLGIRTFVLQGGEDPWYTDDKIEHLIVSIKTEFPDCAVTLSIGEKSRESLARFKRAGADRYLLRHETADEEHYRYLHPAPMSLPARKQCLFWLKELGYQTGAGFMVGSPGQTNRCIAADLEFLTELSPEMVGIGPFIPHHATPFREEAQGSAEKTLLLLSIVRILLPRVLLPATTALGTADADGRRRGLLYGANVVMPNLSPIAIRGSYDIYDNKVSTGEEAAESIRLFGEKIARDGFEIVVDRGDAVTKQQEKL